MHCLNPIILRPEISQTGRRIAISDIHGCAQTFSALLAQIALTKEDSLFLLGDYIHRGPNEEGLIKNIINLQSSGYQVFCLRGNHEQMLIDSHRKREAAPFFSEAPAGYSTRGLRLYSGLIKPEYLPFFDTLPYLILTAGFYLVHAGLNFAVPDPFSDFHSMLWIRDWKAEPADLQGNRTVFGHTPTGISVIREAVKNRSDLIPLDNACFRGLRGKKTSEFGRLCALDLDSFRLYEQENVEEKRKS